MCRCKGGVVFFFFFLENLLLGIFQSLAACVRVIVVITSLAHGRRELWGALDNGRAPLFLAGKKNERE